MDINDFFNILSVIGINACIVDNNVYFYDLKYNNHYNVYNNLNKAMLDNVSLDIFNNKPFIQLISESRRIDLYVDKDDNNKVIINTIHILEDSLVYNVEFVKYPSGKKVVLFSIFDYNQNEVKNIIEVSENEYVYIYDKKDDQTFFYKLLESSYNLDFIRMNEVISSNKYVSLFLDYYSKNNPDFLDTFNNYKIDSMTYKKI